MKMILLFLVLFSCVAINNLQGQFTCGDDITVNHVAGDVAPVNKTVIYGTVDSVPGEPVICWMTTNLGADHQASSKDDASEASAGWYWQFNRKQGYKHDGETRTPDTQWISIINENSDWMPENDPCNLELGFGWRIPTQSEWVNVNDIGEWYDWNGPWESLLKLHSGGFLDQSDGSLQMRGMGGAFWSNLQGGYTTAWYERFNDTLCGYAGHYKARGYSIRCVKGVQQVVTPEICIVSVTQDNHNQLVWEKQITDQIAFYKIYRETSQTDVYEVIGFVDYADLGIFVDVNSNPQQRAYKYKLSAVSVTENETLLSAYHKTIHLNISEWPAGWNLIWNPYEGFAYSTYYIYRGNSQNELVLLDSISGSFTSYSDIDPPAGPLYYAIEIINEEGCSPVRDDNFDRSRSNIQYNGLVGVEDVSVQGISIYPNPASDFLDIQIDVSNPDASISIYNIQGKAMISQSLLGVNTKIDISVLNPGVYIMRIKLNQDLLIRKLVVK